MLRAGTHPEVAFGVVCWLRGVEVADTSGEEPILMGILLPAAAALSGRFDGRSVRPAANMSQIERSEACLPAGWMRMIGREFCGGGVNISLSA